MRLPYNRALARELMTTTDVRDYATRLTDLARQLNSFAGNLKSQRYGKDQSKTIRESSAEYVTVDFVDAPAALFSDDDLEWLRAVTEV